MIEVQATVKANIKLKCSECGAVLQAKVQYLHSDIILVVQPCECQKEDEND